eukprot:gnl/MRDRNA2_/MRDRNA2_116918_c0_seq1.p1 gnl/MRDRNA2_/MRDRNA2_116918_c0~~gnl/MRDRNA2_/MRDRNA2_116918_c0_seq1.p1  ORF type:complete len:483 (+),score=64.06 gnl/MRDRNA2_/MRDRNA2_116918_c0_seq1:187-1635(+)
MSSADETTPLRTGQERRGCLSVALRVRLLTMIISFAEGYDIGVVNGAVILFQEELNLLPWQVGVVLAIFPSGVAICAPMAGSFADAFGRKPTMMLSSVLLIVGGLVMAFSHGFYSLAAGRLTAGSGVGVGITAVTAYMSEVSPSHSRGFYGSLEELFVNIGNVGGYLINVALLGVMYDWRIMLGLGVIPATIVLIILVFPYSLTGIPESPRWLAKVGRMDEAREVLIDLLDGDVIEADKAFEAWIQESRDEGGVASWGETLKAFGGTHRRQALAGIGCGIMNMFTGIMLMMIMTTSLLVATGMDKRTAMWTSVGLGCAKAGIMLIVAFCFLDNWGRRPLLLVSLGLCASAASLGSCAAFYTWGESFIVAGLAFFVMGYSVGVGPVPWVYMPEVLDNRFRGKGTSIGLSGARICAVTQVLLYPIVFPMIGVGGLFVFLLTVNLIGFLYIFVLCPETKNRSLEQISQLFVEDSDAYSPKAQKVV